MDDFEELVGAVVALVLRDLLAQRKIPGFGVLERGDHVPAAASGAQMVQRGKGACQFIGLEIAGRAGGHQTQVPGDARHGRQHQRGVQPHGAQRAVAQLAVGAALEAVGNGQNIGKKSHVETASLERLRDLLIVGWVEPVGFGAGVAPAAGSTGTGNDEGGQMHLAGCCLGHGNELTLRKLSGA